jgi:P27 family predicted phage terminase small subunit
MKSLNKSTVPTPPKHLSAESKALWSSLLTDWEMTDDMLAILRNALEANDRVIEAKNILDKDGLIVIDRFGQKQKHPAASIERDNRALMARLLASLKLETEAPRGPGRPPGGHLRSH